MISKGNKSMIYMLRKMRFVSIIFVVLCLFACKSAQKSANVKKVYFSNVDEAPMFGGRHAEEEFRRYVWHRTLYPVQATTNGAANILIGRVFVEFIVEKDGSVSNAKIVGGADPLFEKEALRLVNSSPNWTPGKINGEAVRVSYTLPFSFNGAIGDEGKGILTSKKAKLSKKTILLEEIVITVLLCCCN